MAYFMRTLAFLTLSLVMLFPTHNANAQSDEQQLKTIFETLVQSQKTKIDAKNNVNVVFDGEVVVEPVDDFFAVTLPHIKIEYADGDVLDVGIISVNASTHDTNGQWKMSLALPTAINLQDQAGQDIMRLNIGTQNAAGIWDENLQNFAKLDAMYKDISMESSDPQLVMSLPSIEVRHDFDRDDQGLWSGPYFITAKDISFEMAEKETSIKLAEAKARFDLDRYNPSKTNDFKNIISRLRTNNAARTPEQRAELASQAVDTALTAGNGFTSNYTVSDLKVSYKDKVDEKNSFALKTAHLGLDLTGILNNDISLGVRAGYNDFKLDAQRAEYAGFDPTNTNIDLKIEHIPAKEIFQLGENMVSSIIAQPETASLVGLSLFMKIPALLSQAQTVIKIKDSYISSDEYKVTLDGDIKADMNAVNSATAKAQAKFFGLDKILAKTQVLAEDPDNKHITRFQEIKRKLLLLKSLGKIETDDDNKFVHVFDIIMNPQGQILINDQNYRTIGQTPAPTIEEIEKQQPITEQP